jgi:tRNA dimethylallyltransferase
MQTAIPSVVFLLGPTASGKTALACQLIDRFPDRFDLISVDSALVYRGMNIGTAKPDAATLARYPHQLIDLIDPTQAYSAADFRRDALAAIARSHEVGKTPLLVGGTMMYVKALTEGLSALPPANPSIRKAIEAKAAESGWPALHLQLALIDPATAARLAPNDSQRIQRALEVYELTGVPLSQLQTRTETRESNGGDIFPYAATTFALMPATMPDRAVLHERIATRFDAMLAAGFVEEVCGLRERYALTPEMPSMRCVGYRQAWQFIDGEIDADTLRETGIIATRQLAKRQMTWLRAMPEAITLDCLAEDLVVQTIAALNHAYATCRSGSG